MSVILGLDFGERRIGVAISDESGTYAFPRPAVIRNERTDPFETISALCRAEAVGKVVLGLPLDQHGAEGERAAAVRAFGDQVAARTGLPVVYVDERFSSRLATQMMREAQRSPRKAAAGTLDSLAAQTILETYLSRHAD